MATAIARVNNQRPVGKQIRFPQGHNFQEIGNGSFMCKDCSAELINFGTHFDYVPGTGDCDES
jgi:hypothetical protein